MIPFPFSLFSRSDIISLIYTGVYEDFDIYYGGIWDTYLSGHVFESGFTIPRTGFSTGTSFLASAYFIEDFSRYSESQSGFSTLYSGVLVPLPSPLYTTGKVYDAFSFMSDNWKQPYVVPSPESYRFIFTGYYSGWTSSGPIPIFGTGLSPNLVAYMPENWTQPYSNTPNQEGGVFTGYYSGSEFVGQAQPRGTGVTIWGWIPPALMFTGTSFTNLGTKPPFTFSGSGVLFSGGHDRAGGTTIFYNNKTSGLYFRLGQSLQLYKASASINDFTVEFQMKRSGWGDSDAHIIDHHNFSGFAIFRNGTSNNLRMGVSGSFFNSDVTISDQSWTHVAFMRSGTSGICYISGMQRNSVVQNTLTISHGADYFIGRNRTNGTQGYIGWIDEVRFWNYARTREEIAAGATGSVTPVAALIGYLQI